MANKKVIIIGAGGHAKVIADIIQKAHDDIIGFLDDKLEKGKKVISNYEIIGQLEDIERFQQKDEDTYFIIAIGNNKIRKEIAEKYKDISYYIAIHPSAQIGLDVVIEKGTVVMANACINSSAKIGKHCIINTGAIIEHDNILEDYVHISPNSALGGTVIIGENVHIGIGTTVKNNVSICSNCTVGAGAVVTKNIDKEGTYIGVPAKRLK